jgi:hypothetical protein
MKGRVRRSAPIPSLEPVVNRKFVEVEMVEYRTGLKQGLALTILAACCSLAACGGGGDSATAATADTALNPDPVAATAPAPGPTTSVSTAALALSGTPSGSAKVGVAYSFTPALQPVDAAATFSVTNKPSWANFSIATGELSGTPAASDLGTHPNIVITANTGGTSATLASFSIDVTESSTVGSATLSWVPPTSHTDGSSLSNLGGYNIYYGGSAETMTNKIQVTNPGLTAYVVGGLGAGTHFFGITAYSTAGSESDLAVVGSKTIM